MGEGSYTELVLYGELPARQEPVESHPERWTMEASSVTRRPFRYAVVRDWAWWQLPPLLRRGRSAHRVRHDRVRGDADHLDRSGPARVLAAAGLRHGLGRGHPASRVRQGGPDQGLPHRLGAPGGDRAPAGLRHAHPDPAAGAHPVAGAQGRGLPPDLHRGRHQPDLRVGVPAVPPVFPLPRPRRDRVRGGPATHAITWVLAVAICELVGGFGHKFLIIAAIKLSDPSVGLAGLALNREALLEDFAEVDLSLLITVVVAVTPVLPTPPLPPL